MYLFVLFVLVCLPVRLPVLFSLLDDLLVLTSLVCFFLVLILFFLFFIFFTAMVLSSIFISVSLVTTAPE